VNREVCRDGPTNDGENFRNGPGSCWLDGAAKREGEGQAKHMPLTVKIAQRLGAVGRLARMEGKRLLRGMA
jgi:hypothetical protein